MNVLFIKHFFVGFMVSEIPIVSVFGHCPYSVTFPYRHICNQSSVKHTIMFVGYANISIILCNNKGIELNSR